MIQRVQTVYLILIAICAGLVFAFPFSSYQIGGNEYVYNVFGFTMNKVSILTIPLYPIIMGIGGLAILSIFLYKNRKLQLRINQANYLLILGAIVLLFLDFGSLETALGEDSKSVSYGIGMFLPVACLVFNFLANRGIKNDEKLIKSMDRLR